MVRKQKAPTPPGVAVVGKKTKMPTPDANGNRAERRAAAKADKKNKGK